MLFGIEAKTMNARQQPLRFPRIVSISNNQRSLLDFNDTGNYVPYRRDTPAFYKQAKLLFTDHEVKLLIFWAIISPSAGLAYLIWTKYENLRLLAVLLFGISIIQFAVQWEGAYTLVKKFLG